ncbi:permease [Lewinella sp. W8]|uniref:permease n=1 Tax=Lewinella sp. W8 TaxID=2528208 RepID=UPI001067DB5F|nr:permease [Lewinella sp. W8]MTB53216.1 permease [Lewinella sp. W8]
MNLALQKTLAFLILMVCGYLLQRKLTDRQDLRGIKVVILSVVLPATIFLALLKIEISQQLLLLPVLALGGNVLFYFLLRQLLPLLGFELTTAGGRTMLLLLPSLAPGLSCFPFVLEYLGDEALAMAAMADVGNKVFVLIVLYLLAMSWYYRQFDRGAMDNRNLREKLKELGGTLLREPVNLVILAALLMLGLGLNQDSLPTFFQTTVNRLAAMMTPIVLLFIGLAVRFRRKQMTAILRLLLLRSGLAFAFSALALTFGSALNPTLAVLVVVFPQSAVSFWPFAHLSAVSQLPSPERGPVFDADLALNVLAFSLPFSTLIMLMVLSAGTAFAQPLASGWAAAGMLVVPLLYVLRGLDWKWRKGAQAAAQKPIMALRSFWEE